MSGWDWLRFAVALWGGLVLGEVGVVAVLIRQRVVRLPGVVALFALAHAAAISFMVVVVVARIEHAEFFKPWPTVYALGVFTLSHVALLRAAAWLRRREPAGH